MINPANGGEILPGDIAVTRIGGNVGRLIRMGELLNGEGFHDYEHAFCYIGGPDLILEAEPGGAVIRSFHYPMNECLWTSGIAAFALPPRAREQVALVAGRYRGVGYSFADYAAVAAHRLRLPIPGLREFVASTRHMICSQLADQFRLDLGNHLFADGRWPGYVTPAAIGNLIESEIAR
jgi:hypothetical protein